MNNKTLQLINNSSLSRGAILLVLYLQNISDGNFPCKRQISRDIDVSERHVGRLLQELVEDGFVDYELKGRKKIYKML